MWWLQSVPIQHEIKKSGGAVTAVAISFWMRSIEVDVFSLEQKQQSDRVGSQKLDPIELSRNQKTR